MSEYLRNHVATRALLARWADPTGRVVCVSKRDNSSSLKRPEKIAYRLKHWGPDLEVRREVERRLSTLEARGLSALNRILERWPEEPLRQDTIDLSILIAIHIRRSPAALARIAQLQEQAFQKRLNEYERDWASHQIDQFIKEMTSDAGRAQIFFDGLGNLVSLLASMHWAIIRFDVPLLATCDQPVTIIPMLAPGEAAPMLALPNRPLFETEEIRMPLDPQHALLATWQPPDSTRQIEGDDRLAADLNRAAVAQADRQWFHWPGRRTTTLNVSDFSSQDCPAVGRRIHAGYSYNSVARSPRRLQTVELLREQIDDCDRERITILESPTS